MAKQENLNIPRPKGWRKGQTIFNFLWWLKEHRLIPTELLGWDGKMAPEYAKGRMADVFNIPDAKLEAYYAEFLLEN